MPTSAAAVLVVVAAAAVGTAAVFQDHWVLRGAVAALAGVVVLGGLLLRRVRRMLRAAQVEAAGGSVALARAESRAGQELLRRDLEIARLNGELGTSTARLREVTGASLYAAAVLAELFRNNPLLSGTADEQSVADEGESPAEAADEPTEDSVTDSASSTVVQVWPSVDDAPTVVDLLRWDQVRRMTDKPALDSRRPA
ncbi:MAG: hypothetical protein GEV07_18315 [Streptosporangiales bacterium]|nr:hypothetical protein [Streptosporangiales bacterium]